MEILRDQYKNEVIPAMMKKFNYKSVMEVPKLDKIVINIGLGDTKENPKSLENAIKIYNERILKTDKGFYEILNYYDENGNIQTTTMKIDLLSKYYDEVLTFTYEYVILQDNTIIPIKDVITNQKEYQPDDYIQTLDKKPESFVE